MALDFGLGFGGDLFPTSSAAGQGMEATVTSQIIWKDIGIGIVPIGGVVSWVPELFDTRPPLLPNFVECNGQVLSDGDSPLDGKTIPDLNGDNRFMRGNATSGTTGGSATHSHPQGGGNEFDNGAKKGFAGTFSTLPPYYNVVWIMRIK